ncbi:ATP-binding cassette domain-containing protein [candidate division KSB3 bacterium]|uniref:ATP-binding cassette domain-containing protein n=1 Tax=candidate division KSB3 bacterium TaxID=2044937 RepID=A0A9D5JUL3_9BACT|nr:ATP-binding cassette domain-containing protein [candidate division KSB3 bacterium]MBD3324409.1 ATP-binding cassette domain-containing protein [candidate division KSB3 bacterium]
MENASASLLKMVNIHKAFGKVVALKGVDFEVGVNEVVGLLGDNGAGKSTLVKTVMGVHPPTTGEIYVRGKQIDLHAYSAQKAHELRIETVYQEKALAEKQSMWRNIFLGRQIKNRFGFIDAAREKAETERIMKNLIGFRGRGVSADTKVSKLSGGERQGVAIARAMYFDADLIILDEPTLALSLMEVQKVLNFVRQIKSGGKACIFISHTISHVYEVADRFVLIDRGEIVGKYRKDQISLIDLTEKMTGIVAASRKQKGE